MQLVIFKAGVSKIHMLSTLPAPMFGLLFWGGCFILEKEMATHSSILAWRIPWKEEPGRLQSTGFQRVGHDRATSIHLLLLIGG